MLSLQPLISIIIPNWNGKGHLDNCISSLLSQTYKNYEIILVDNGSSDGSVEYVKAQYPSVKIIENSHNLGFAQGTNVGIRASKGDYIVTLNNDTKADSRFLEELAKAAEIKDDIGMCAPKVRFFHNPEVIDSTGILIHFDGSGLNRGFKEIDTGQYDEIVEVFGASAGAALYKKKMLDEIGLFDDDFFAYYEDLDLAWRARLAGWRSIYVPSALVYHVHSATGVSYSPFKSFHIQRNRFFVVMKNFPIKMALIAILFTPIRYLYLLNSVRLKKGPAANFKKNNSVITMVSIVLSAWIDALLYLQKMVRKRKIIQTKRRVSTQEIKKWFKNYKVELNRMMYIN